MVHLHVKTRGDWRILGDLHWAASRMADPFPQPIEIQVIVATAIMINMDAECDPDGNPWPDLSNSYATWKATIAPGRPMGYLYGTMKTMDNLMGVAVVQGSQMTMTYGVDPVAIAHAIKFTEGGLVTGTNQPPRPFYGLTTYAEQQLNDHWSTVFAGLW